MKNIHKDVIIIGAGPAGLSLACSLADTNLKILIIEKQSKINLENPEYDGREIALTHFSKKILEKLNIWKKITNKQITLIKEAKVLDGNSPYFLHFDNNNISKNALGYIVSNHLIRKTLYAEIKNKPNIQIVTSTEVLDTQTNKKEVFVTLSKKRKIIGSLLIAADSRFSTTRMKMNISSQINDFERSAILFKIQHERKHYNTAYECFHYGETLAVLPLSKNTSSIVMTVPKKKVNEIINLDKTKLAISIIDKFKNKLGNMKIISNLYSYPLISIFAKKFIGRRFALIGDAAVGMHPVTAHGFNLGLRGQNILALEIKSALSNGLDIGSQTVLEKYESQHIQSTKLLYLGTNMIVKLYTNDSFFSKILRKTVLRIGNNFIPAKRKIMDQLTEISG
tara:strand:+ start:849 stop:2033 length:1185 start_codon:yes stop_codon:yes gene_type:complete